jgi:AcrR family transcriptional regulator
MDVAMGQSMGQIGSDPSTEPPPERRKRGRPATASPDDVLRLATAQYLDGQRVDITVVARQLGLGRATIYRWFGSREQLLGEVIARELEKLAAHKRAQVRRRGAVGLLEVFDRVNRALARSTALRRLLEQERDSAMRLLTSSGGVVEPRAVACIEALITEEVSAGTYVPLIDPPTLAYALVRLRHAFLLNDATTNVRGDHARLHEVQAALLGVPRPEPRAVTRPPRRRRRSSSS